MWLERSNLYGQILYRSSTDNAVRTTRLITGQGRDMSNFKRKLHPDINDTNFKIFLAHMLLYKKVIDITSLISNGYSYQQYYSMLYKIIKSMYQIFQACEDNL